jgi:hypothetical protein
MMMPNTDPKLIYLINRKMDNPDPWSVYLNQYMKKSGHGNAFDIPGLRKMGIENQTITGCLRNDDGVVHVWRKKEGICTQLQTTSCRTL